MYIKILSKIVLDLKYKSEEKKGFKEEEDDDDDDDRIEVGLGDDHVEGVRYFYNLKFIFLNIPLKKLEKYLIMNECKTLIHI